MAVLTTRQQVQTGAVPAPVAAAAGGDRITPGPTTYLRVTNGGGSSITVTINATVVCSQGFDHDLVVAVAAGVTKEIGPLPGSRFADPTDGLVGVAYTGVTTVTVEAVSV